MLIVRFKWWTAWTNQNSERWAVCGETCTYGSLRGYLSDECPISSGFVLNRKNIILMLISIEIMLLAITFLILVSSLNIDDIIGQTYAIYIIVVAGAESAIGLGILVAFYRLKSSLKVYPYFIAPEAKAIKNYLYFKKKKKRAPLFCYKS